MALEQLDAGMIDLDHNGSMNGLNGNDDSIPVANVHQDTGEPCQWTSFYQHTYPNLQMRAGFALSFDKTKCAYRFLVLSG
jgi:hypothetical protein